MGIIEKIKNILVVPDEEDYEEEYEETTEKSAQRKVVQPQESYTQKRVEQAPRVVSGSKNKTVSFTPGQMQVVLVKPERYEDVTSITDHMLERKTVVLNIENIDKDLSRRIVDFLGGATYALHGNIRKVSRGTFLIVPHGVDMMGELLAEDFDETLYL